MITLTYKAIIKFNTSNIDSIPFCAIVLAINAITAYGIILTIVIETLTIIL